MYVTELFMNETTIVEPTPPGYATEKDDQSILKLSDLRKTRLTLAQINRLRKINDIKTIEHEQKLKGLAIQYRPAEQDAGGM